MRNLILSIPDLSPNVPRSHPKKHFFGALAHFLMEPLKNCKHHLSTSTRSKEIEKTSQNGLPSLQKNSFSRCRWGRMGLLSQPALGALSTTFGLTERMGLPRGKLLSNWGRSSLFLSQEESSPFKDRANTPCKMLEGQGNADRSEKN